MYNLNDYSEFIHSQVKTINTFDDTLYKWTVRITENSATMHNKYLDGVDIRIDYKHETFEEPDIPDDDVLYIHDIQTKETVTAFDIGTGRWKDGTMEECLEKAVKEVQLYFSYCY